MLASNLPRPGVMRASALAITSLLIACTARADGVPLKDGRYSGGPVVAFQLTPTQKKDIEHFRSCHLDHSRTMNVYTPYVFALTASQRESLRATKGFAPRLFEIYETYRGFNDAGPHWNLALRFSKDEIEVPLNLLRNEREAAAAHRDQGWKKSNPCFPSIGKR